MAMAREELCETQTRRNNGNQRQIPRERQLQNQSSQVRHRIDSIDTCKYYNTSFGCEKGDDCDFLHICRHFILDDCKYGMRCARSHDMNSKTVKRYLRKQGIDMEPSELKEQLNRKFCIENGKTHKQRLPNRSEEESGTICPFHLKGNCEFGVKCRNHHKDLPYQWQICRFGDDIWYDVEKEINVKLEVSFCNVNNTECRYYHKIGTELTVYFERQKGLNFESSHQVHFRRLSTPPYQKGKHFAYATEWTWYWETNQDTWEKYGDTGEVTTNNKLEAMYLENPHSEICIEEAMTGYNYIINFDVKCQVNTVSTTKRKIRRRPTFFAPAALEKIWYFCVVANFILKKL